MKNDIKPDKDVKKLPELPKKEEGSTSEKSVRVENPIQPIPRDRKPGSGRPSTEEKLKREQAEKLADAAQKIFTAEVWKPVACLPFDLLFLSTKYEGFVLTPEESERSGLLLAKVLEIYTPELDPKIMIVSAFAVDYLTLLGKRIFSWQMTLKQQNPGHPSQK